MFSYVRKARRRIAARGLDATLRRYEPRLAAAFREAVKHVNSRISIAQISRLLEAGDIEGAINLAAPAEFGERLAGRRLTAGQRSLRDEWLSAYQSGGRAAAAQFPRNANLIASLDLTNPRSVEFVRGYVPGLIKEITDESRRAVQAAIQSGFEQGRDLPAIAREVRGSVGLTRLQSKYVDNFRQALETGRLDPRHTPVDQRRLSAVEQVRAKQFFDQAAAGSPVSQSKINELVNRYHESLVNRRAKNIARTEAHRAHIEGQKELWAQAQEEGLLDPTTTRRIWIVTPDDRLRDSHSAVPGMNPNGVGLEEPFQTPIGPVLDPGASGDPAFDINCRCTTALEFDE